MPSVLVAGCGFLGLAAARLFHAAGWAVTGLTHSADSAAALGNEPFPVLQGDVSERDTLSVLALPPFEAVVHCVSSGKGGADQYRSVYLGGARNLLDVFSPTFLLFTSSTSVYAQNDGSVVTEHSPAEPGRETGQILRETEDLVLGAHGCVARLAGLYGPGRSVLLQRFFSGEAVIEGDGDRFVNQVHRDDAAAAVVHLVRSRITGVFNVGDDAPLTQREIYTWLAGRFQRPVPPSGPINPNRKRGVTNKRVDNSKLRALGWAPAYSSFRDAVERDRALTDALPIAG
jgi:nucleoside-diphosphate-sugar epimerase